MDRQQAIDLCRECIKELPTSYSREVDPAQFDPHEWVIQAVIKAGSTKTMELIAPISVNVDSKMIPAFLQAAQVLDHAKDILNVVTFDAAHERYRLNLLDRVTRALNNLKGL